MKAACEGEWELFDSTIPADHAQARLLCETCPVLDKCGDRLREAQQAAVGSGPSGMPSGTWAGRLLGAKDVGYRTPGVSTEVLIARAAYVRGDRTDWAVAGNREYERDRRARRQQSRRARAEATA